MPRYFDAACMYNGPMRHGIAALELVGASMARQRTRAFKLPAGLLGRSSLRLVVLVVLLLTLSLLVSFGEQVVQGARMEQQRRDVEATVVQLRADRDNLMAGVAYAESDVYVEQRAREMLNLAREGDTVVLPQLPPPAPTATPVPQALPPP
jgi:cell division protein FtsB